MSCQFIIICTCSAIGAVTLFYEVNHLNMETSEPCKLCHYHIFFFPGWLQELWSSQLSLCVAGCVTRPSIQKVPLSQEVQKVTCH